METIIRATNRGMESSFYGNSYECISCSSLRLPPLPVPLDSVSVDADQGYQLIGDTRLLPFFFNNEYLLFPPFALFCVEWFRGRVCLTSPAPTSFYPHPQTTPNKISNNNNGKGTFSAPPRVQIIPSHTHSLASLVLSFMCPFCLSNFFLGQLLPNSTTTNRASEVNAAKSGSFIPFHPHSGSTGKQELHSLSPSLPRWRQWFACLPSLLRPLTVAKVADDSSVLCTAAVVYRTQGRLRSVCEWAVGQ